VVGSCRCFTASDPNASGNASEVPALAAGESATTAFKRYSARTEMYRKFKKGKDLTSYSASQLKEIMGKTDADDASSKCTITYSTATAVTTKAAAPSSENFTVNASSSIHDYFKNKMAGTFD
jgi:hypothetical protein